MFNSKLLNESEKSLDIELANENGKTYSITLAKVGDFSTSELVERWTRRFNMEFVRNRVNFERYLNRIGSRHQKIINGEIDPIINEN